MKIAIVGAGLAGLVAAYDLLHAGHAVEIYEASAHTGGLARGFRDRDWAWPLEHFYHHLFETDDAIIALVNELGMRDKLFFPQPRTSIYHDGQIYPFSNPRDWWRFPPFDPLTYARFGAVGAFLRYTRTWRYLEQATADEWTRRYFGRKIHALVWRPLLIGKFGPHYRDVNMAWLWARLHVRSFRLGYFEGGFQAFVDRLTAAVQARGGVLRLGEAVQQIAPQAGSGLALATAAGTTAYDQVLHTTAPALLARLVPTLPRDYLDGILALKSMAAVVLVLALRQSLLTDGTYWLNLPATSADKQQNPVPFLALVEHTNYIDRRHYNGDHIVYCGDYVPVDHPYMQMSQAEIETRFIGALGQFQPQFRPDWVRASWLFRAAYAQPVPALHHSRNIPAIATPLPNLYMASMSQVYPWDRGTNFAVEIGRRAAREMMQAGR